MKKIILLISVILLLGGCYNYKELNHYAIATGMAIDYDVLTVQECADRILHYVRSVKSGN